MSDCKCESVSHFHGREGQDYAKSHLKQLTVDDENWKILYKCPITNEFWEEYFPRADEHGGGASEFEKISREQALREFGSFAD